MSRSNLIKSLKFIYWKKEARMLRVTREEFKAIYTNFKDTGRCMKQDSKTSRYQWCVQCKAAYRLDKRQNWMQLYTYTKKDGFVIYTTNILDDRKNHGEIKSDSNALKYVRKRFENLNNITMLKAFGTVEEEIKYCVPRQFTVEQPIGFDKVFDKLSAVDYSSHYPSCICGRLPTSINSKRFKGTVKPNEEYPFAFYIRSGFVAEYGVFDSHIWATPLNKKYTPNLFTAKQNPYIDPEDDETVLMKASDYTLDEVYKYYYNKRKIDEDAKLVMNASIGCMHRREYRKDKYAHLAAIALGRANSKMLDLAAKIGPKDLIQICVDGVLYKGDKVFGSENKEMGELHQEFTGLSGRYAGFNKYIIKDLEGNVIKDVHGNCNIDSRNGMYIKNVSDFSDIDYWIKVNYLEDIENEIIDGR